MMRTTRRAPALPRVAAVALLLLSVAAPLAPARVVAAEPPTFEPGTLSSDFPSPVSWRFTFRSESAPLRIELLRRLPGTDGTLVSTVAPDDASQRADDSWVVAGSDESAVRPNTAYRMRLRVTTAEGVFIGPEAEVLVEDERLEWRVRESERLRLHWYRGDNAFAQRALRIGEEAVTRAEDFLGVKLSSGVDIFVYADEAPFRDAIGPRSPENAAGVPFANIATLFALIRPDEVNSSWVADIVPHELTHLVLEAGIGPGVELPLWLNEGLAVYLSIGYTSSYRDRVGGATRDGTVVPLDGLSGNFPTTAAGDRSVLAYGEAVSAVDYLVRTYGQAKMAKLVAAFGSQGADEAFTSALGVDTASFGANWLDSIGASQPRVYGPLAAPTGPLPSDWLGPAPSAGLLPGSTASAGSTPAPGVPGSKEGSASAGVLLAILATGVFLAALLAALLYSARRSRP